MAVLIVVASLYFARGVLIPLALAILFTFLLAPSVTRLRHWGLGRTPAVLVVVVVALTVAGTFGLVMTSQMVELARKMPEYKQNIHNKLQTLGKADSGAFGRLINSVQELRKDVEPKQQPTQTRTQTEPAQAPAPTPMQVEVHNPAPEPLQIVQTVVGSLLGAFVTTFIVVVFVIFMLVERESLRDRLIRMLGMRKLNLTTHLLDETSQRVSRYLLMQLIVNITFGLLIAIGLYFIGIPNPMLFGMLAGLLRYIPYAGPWIGASMPFMVGLAVDPEWSKPLYAIGLFAVVEIVLSNVIEPWLYGSSTGMTPLAVLLSAVFWARLWGPVGLLLSMPLTVCVVSIGRHIPHLGFLNILLGDEPALSPPARFYQRMLAGDPEEATDMGEEFLKEKGLGELYDEMILPALVMAENDRERGALDEEKYDLMMQQTRLLVDDLPDYAEKLRRKSDGEAKAEGSSPAVALREPWAIVRCVTSGREADELAATMLGQLLELKGITTRILSTTALIKERAEAGDEEKASVACISAVGAGGFLSARQAYRRLGRQFGAPEIVAGLWNATKEADDFLNRLTSMPKENVVTTLSAAVEAITSRISKNDKDRPEAGQVEQPEVEHAEH